MSFIFDNFTDRVVKDTRVRFNILPQRIVWVDNGDGQIFDVENLLEDDLTVSRVVVSGSVNPAIVLDYGSELNGGIEIYLANEAPNPKLKARIRFGESVSEVMNEPNNDHAMHDMKVEMSIMGKHEFGSTGFRFVRIDFEGCSETVNLASVNAVALEHDYEYSGNFECSDELLNNIWRVGARTVQLCCQDYIYDGIKRDRLLWAGDLHPQINVIANVFGDVDIVRKTLDRARKVTAADKWMNGHSAYSLWWIICVYDWYFYTADIEWLRSHASYLEKLVCNILRHIDENGREHLTGHRFLDWVIGFDEATLEPGLHALTILGLQKALKIYDILDIGDSQELSEILDKMLNVCAGYSDAKQVCSIEALAGLVTPIEANQRSLSDNPCKKISTWFAYYDLQVRAMAGDFEGSLNMIREFWGGMLSLGATTFWEHFNTDWLTNAQRIDELPVEGKVDVHKDCGEYCFVGLRHSLCHGWSGGPTAWMSQYILGVRPVSPGFKQVVIEPQLGDLDYAKGAVPTPYGNIEVEVIKDEYNELEINYKIPKGVELITATESGTVG